MGFSDLRARYSTSEPVVVGDVPPGAASVICRTAFGVEHAARLESGSAVFSHLPPGTHAIEAWATEGGLIAEELTSVTRSPGDDPVMAFASSFRPEAVEGTLAWLRALRCTVVQFYDWMQRYSDPLPPDGEYTDPLRRRLSRPSLEHLVSGVLELGAVAQAYAPVCAAEPAFAETHRDWRLFRGDGAAQHLGTLLQIMDPANTAWQEHWLSAYSGAARTIGFNGFHLDTYGYPRCALDSVATPRSMEQGYGAFLGRVRAALAGATLSFNQVNGVPAGLEIPSPPAFRYAEVWSPNDLWRHLEGLLARAGGRYGWSGGALALYPPVWGEDREGAVRTVTLTEAVTTALGAGLLVLGDLAGVLRDPYYPNHERLAPVEASTILAGTVSRCGAVTCSSVATTRAGTTWVTPTAPSTSKPRVSPSAPNPLAGHLFRPGGANRRDHRHQPDRPVRERVRFLERALGRR